MKLLQALLENDIEHREALNQTGFWGRKGAGAIVFSLETRRFLIGFRSEMVEQPNTWGTFGGAIDSAEQPLKAAIRETVEETGLDINAIVDYKLIHTFKDEQTGFEYFNYILVVEDEFDPILNWENDIATWFECDTILATEPKHFGLKDALNSQKFKQFKNNYC